MPACFTDGDFDRGSKRQAIFQLAGVKLALNICYEDVYPGLLRSEVRIAEVLVTVTNDSWFGRSSARYQHLQIARMRARMAGATALQSQYDVTSVSASEIGRSSYP